MKNIMSVPRKHHYVPRVYLKQFAQQARNEWQIIVIDKRSDKTFIANIKDVAAENDFYRTDNEEDSFYWEYYYSEKVESIINSTFKNLISACKISVNQSCVISNDLKLKMAKIICSQLLRTKKSREYHLEIGTEVTRKVIENTRKKYEGLLSNDQIVFLKEFKYDEKLNKSLILPIINNEERINKFIDLLLDRYWVVYKNINYKTFPLITSDHPVVMYNIKTNETDFSSNGLAQPYTVFFFPLNPELVIGIYSKTVYIEVFKELNNKIVVIDDIPFVTQLNKIQYAQCYRQSYFNL